MELCCKYITRKKQTENIVLCMNKCITDYCCYEVIYQDTQLPIDTCPFKVDCSAHCYSIFIVWTSQCKCCYEVKSVVVRIKKTILRLECFECMQVKKKEFYLCVICKLYMVIRKSKLLDHCSI